MAESRRKLKRNHCGGAGDGAGAARGTHRDFIETHLSLECLRYLLVVVMLYTNKNSPGRSGGDKTKQKFLADATRCSVFAHIRTGLHSTNQPKEHDE